MIYISGKQVNVLPNSNTSRLLQLPDVIILKILQYLPRDDTIIALLTTCSYLHRFMYHEDLWITSYLTFSGRVPLGCVQGKGLCYPRLTHLSLYDCPSASDTLIGSITRCNPWINAVDISRCNSITDDGLEHLARNLSSVRHLVMASAFRVTWTGLAVFFEKHAESLSFLDISDASGLLKNRRHSSALLRLHKLKEFRASWPRRLEYNNLYPLQDCDIASVLEKNPCLSEVDISSSSSGDLTFTTLSSERFSSLKKLILAYISPGTSYLHKMINNISGLEHLDLTGCVSLTQSTIEHICHVIPNLRELNLTQSSVLYDNLVTWILQRLSRLSWLSLRGCGQVIGACLLAVPEHPSLCYLDISDTLVDVTLVIEMQKHIEKHKCLVVATDGCPNSSLCETMDKWLQESYPFTL